MTLASLRGDWWWTWSHWFCPGHGVPPSSSCRSTSTRLRGGGGGRSLQDNYGMVQKEIAQIIEYPRGKHVCKVNKTRYH